MVERWRQWSFTERLVLLFITFFVFVFHGFEAGFATVINTLEKGMGLKRERERERREKVGWWMGLGKEQTNRYCKWKETQYFVCCSLEFNILFLWSELWIWRESQTQPHCYSFQGAPAIKSFNSKVIIEGLSELELLLSFIPYSILDQQSGLITWIGYTIFIWFCCKIHLWFTYRKIDEKHKQVKK